MRRVFALVVLLSCLQGVTSAAAHPHVFVDAQAGFEFDTDGRLVSLRITWTYDAFTTLTLFDILDLDIDGDGQLNAADHAAIVAGETDWAPDYPGDTYLEMQDQGIALTRPVDSVAWMENEQISVAFDLPLQTPLEIKDEAVLRLYDPTYYYAYTIIGQSDVSHAGCSADTVPFVADAASAKLQDQLAKLSREEMPEQENVGRLFSDEVWLRCS
ncbi:MAG: DUF1007 family protein [Pseudomonadota bacterium]